MREIRHRTELVPLRAATAVHPEPHAATRLRPRKIFDQEQATFGSERIWHALRAGNDKNDPIHISEKATRRFIRKKNSHHLQQKTVPLRPLQRRGQWASRGTESSATLMRTSRTSPGSLTSHSSRFRASSITYLQLWIASMARSCSRRPSKLPDAGIATSTLLRAIEFLGSDDRLSSTAIADNAMQVGRLGGTMQ